MTKLINDPENRIIKDPENRILKSEILKIDRVHPGQIDLCDGRHIQPHNPKVLSWTMFTAMSPFTYPLYVKFDFYTARPPNDVLINIL